MNKSYSILPSYLVLLILAIAISGCDGTYNCLEADDFGHVKIKISSRYGEDKLVQKSHNLQIAPWIDSNLVTDGNPMMIMVKGWDRSEPNEPGVVSAWCPWYGRGGEDDVLSSFAIRFPICYSTGPLCCNKKNLPVANAPCVLTNGIGLYMLIPKTDANPNSDLLSGNIDGVTMHVGEEQNEYSVYDISFTGKLRKVRAIRYDPSNFTSTAKKIYFKILDKYYRDNSGGYVLHVKSGVEGETMNPFKFITQVVREFLFGDGKKMGVVNTMYNSIINSSSYRLIVSTLLLVYVSVAGMSFTIGSVEMNKTEITSRIFKICIISMLINTKSSWDFFHNYLFVFFIEFLDSVLNIISVSQSGSGGADAMSMLLSKETFIKLSALIFVEWAGIIYVILFVLAILLILFLTMQASVYYGFSLLMMGFVISLAPIFICTILFDITQELFKNWLRQLISYFLQIIVLFVGLTVTTNIVRNEVYGSLGFGVCKLPLIRAAAFMLGNDNRELLGWLDKNLYIWIPAPLRNFTGIYETIPIPNGHMEDTRYCRPYECTGKRYVEFPFLDPKDPLDQRQLSEFFNGHFVHFSSLATLAAVLALMYYTNVSSIQIGQMLASNVGSTSGDIARASSQFVSQTMFVKKILSTPLSFLPKNTQIRLSYISNKILDLPDKIKAISENQQGNVKTKDELTQEALALSLTEQIYNADHPDDEQTNDSTSNTTQGSSAAQGSDAEQGVDTERGVETEQGVDTERGSSATQGSNAEQVVDAQPRQDQYVDHQPQGNSTPQGITKQNTASPQETAKETWNQKAEYTPSQSEPKEKSGIVKPKPPSQNYQQTEQREYAKTTQESPDIQEQISDQEQLLEQNKQDTQKGKSDQNNIIPEYTKPIQRPDDVRREDKIGQYDTDPFAPKKDEE